MEWSFESEDGVVTVRQEGDRAVCQAIRPGGEGVYKAWLLGRSGQALLGTLIPEGGALRLRRLVGVGQLSRQGAWPPTGARLTAVLAGSETPPRGWTWADCPGRLMGDRLLSRTLRGVDRGLVRRDPEGFFLALPYDPSSPFPMPPLFCLGVLKTLGDRRYVIFRFTRSGCPELLHNSSELGETTSEDEKGGNTNA